MGFSALMKNGIQFNVTKIKIYKKKNTIQRNHMTLLQV